MSKSWDCLKKRLSQTFARHGAISDFCRKTGIARSNVDKWFYDKNPSSPNIEKLDLIAEAIGLKPWDAIKPEDEPIVRPHTILDCIRTVQNMRIVETPDHTLSIKMQSHPPPYEPNVLKAIPSEPSKLEYQDPQIQELISLFTTLDESQKTSAIGFIKSLGWASVSTTQDKQKKSK